MARRRYQKGSVRPDGDKWLIRWREDVIVPEGLVKRINRKERWTKAEFPTKKLAQRELDKRLAPINSPSYRPKVTMAFGEFAEQWRKNVLPQHKPSTQASVRSHLGSRLVPMFGNVALRDFSTFVLQQWVTDIKDAVSSKTVHNLIGTLKMMWQSAKAWGYVDHDPFAGLVLPTHRRGATAHFSLEDTLRIINAAPEPYKTFYWLAAETGMRPGEVCGLRWEDMDFERRLVTVQQSAWHGKLQAPKTEAGIRAFLISTQLCEHLRHQRSTGLIFMYRNGRPWKGEKVVEFKLKPLLKQLGIEKPAKRVGLYAFRHFNGSMMDHLGTPVKVRQDRLGHTDPRVTLAHYTHADSVDHREIADKLGQVLCPIVSNSEKGSESNKPEAPLIQ